MIKKNLFFLFSILLYGCSIYPLAVDVPLIKERNDLRIDAGISLAATVHSTISYGLTEKIAVQGFGSYGADNSFFQGSVGYYKNTGNDKIIEWYNGFGSGYSVSYNDANQGNLAGNSYLGFTQFNFGKVKSRFANMDYGIGLKTGFLHTKLTDQDYFEKYSNEENFDSYPYPIQKDNSFLFQPTAFIRIGGEKLKFNLNICSALVYQFTNQNKKLPIGNFNVGLSLNYNINTKK